MPSKKTTERKMDSLDIKIIKDLLRNSRKPFSEIASECKVSTLTVKNRFNKLKREGIIRGASVLVDLSHFGVECTGGFLINVNPNQLSEFLRDARNMLGEFSVNCQKFTEKYNVSIWTSTRRFKDLEKVKESLKQHSAIIDIRSYIWTYMEVSPDNLAMET